MRRAVFARRQARVAAEKHQRIGVAAGLVRGLITNGVQTRRHMRKGQKCRIRRPYADMFAVRRNTAANARQCIFANPSGGKLAAERIAYRIIKSFRKIFGDFARIGGTVQIGRPRQNTAAALLVQIRQHIGQHAARGVAFPGRKHKLGRRAGWVMVRINLFYIAQSVALRARQHAQIRRAVAHMLRRKRRRIFFFFQRFTENI